MTWTPDGPQGLEAAKIAPLVVPYTRGRVLDIGSGQSKCWPHFIGVDDHTDTRLYNHDMRPDIVAKADDLSLFADGSVDAVFSSHCLEHIQDTQKALREWFRVIRPGGHLCLYLPHADLYPRIGQPGANPDHRWDFRPDDIIEHMRDVAEQSQQGWTLRENEVRSGDDPAPEYSFYQVFQKRRSAECEFDVWQRNPDGKKRALVIRFGAIGDQLQASSILPLLKEQGYHITYMTTPYSQEIVRHHPSIDDWLIQDKDQVPNGVLDYYISVVSQRYDKVVNFSESIEGTLLTLPGRAPSTWLPEARRKIIGQVNYEERMHDLADVPYRFESRFHPTKQERWDAVEFRNSIKGPVVYWAIGGTSVHKIYPFTNVVIHWLTSRTDAHLVLAAGPDLVELEAGLIASLQANGTDMARVHRTVDDWNVRRALTFVEYADVVVGPETGILNAAAHLDVPKIVMLSHSSPTNLTKHWRRTISLEPDKARTPCYPCHRMHYGWEHCVKVKETQAALCASNITPETVFQAIKIALKRDDGIEKVVASFGRQEWPAMRPLAAADD